MELHDLHEEYMNKLDSTTLVNYLLDCVPFLKTNDLDGWKRRFQNTSPEKTSTEPRQVCLQCNTNDYLVHDRVQDTVVCSTCGTVVDAMCLGTDVAHMSVDRIETGTRHVVHRYSRLVYFKSFLASLQAKTKPVNTETLLVNLRATIDGPISVDAVYVALRKLKKSTQYRRHAVTLAKMLNPELHVIEITDEQLCHLLTMFEYVERYWDRQFKHSLKQRKSFFSYPYILYQFAYHLNYTHLIQYRFLLKDYKLRHFQHYMYRQICNIFKWKCDITH